MTEVDALVGLRFEVGGGLGRMSGTIVGKAGQLYLVQKAGADFLELLQLDDLRSAKFYHMTVVATGSSAGQAEAAEVPAQDAAEAAARTEAPEPVKRRLADQLRRQLGAGRSGDGA
jgi:hypothetical protein